MKLDDIIQQPGQMERLQQQSILGKINVARPGKVVRYDETTKCVDVQPMVRDLHSNKNPPLWTNVPVIFFGEFTYDIQVGDECIVIFADISTDGWWQTGKLSSPVTGRKHDMSDGFALVGVRSLPNVGKGRNLNEIIEDITSIGVRLYILGEDGCLYLSRAEGSAYIDDDGNMVYEEGSDLNFYLDSDGYLWMEVS